MSNGSERKRIRLKVIEILERKLVPNIAKMVLTNRSHDTEPEDLPLVIVYTKNETVERFSESPKMYFRTLFIELEIQIEESTDEDLSDHMDDLSQKVEDAIEGAFDELWNFKDSKGQEALINDWDLASVDYDTEGHSFAPFGSIRLNYAFQYYTDEDRSPRVDDLETIDTTYNANGNTDGDARDKINY